MPLTAEFLDEIADLEIVRAEKARRSLYTFTKHAWPIIEPTTQFVDGWHIGAICEHLEACQTGQIKNLLINMPPRHMKSIAASVMFPAWSWLQDPSKRFMYSSYALSLAGRDARKSKLIMMSDWYQRHYGSRFSFTTASTGAYENDKRGYRLAVSVGSSATGEGGDFVVVDDPHNVVEAVSDAVRETTLTWWDTSMSTRLNDPRTGVRIVIGQRVHEQDLSGHILDGEYDYEHLVLPAEYEGKKYFTSIWEDPRTKDGQLLWPERFGPKEIDQAKVTLGAYGYSAQFQQRPSPDKGGMFERGWFDYFYEARGKESGDAYWVYERAGKRVVVPKSDCFRVAFMDLAISTKASADRTVIGTCDFTPEGDILVLDIDKGRWEAPDQLKRLRNSYARFGPSFIGIEAVAYQASLVHFARRSGLPIRMIRPDKNKVARASTASVKYEAGQIYHLKGAPWVLELEDELLSFTRNDTHAHDDQVDVIAYAAIDAAKQRAGRGAKVQAEVI